MKILPVNAIGKIPALIFQEFLSLRFRKIISGRKLGVTCRRGIRQFPDQNSHLRCLCPLIPWYGKLLYNKSRLAANLLFGSV